MVSGSRKRDDRRGPLRAEVDDDGGFGAGDSLAATKKTAGVAIGEDPSALAGTSWFGLDVPEDDAKGGKDGADGAKKKKTGKGAKGPKKPPAGSFASFGLGHAVIKAVTRKGYRQPTPIQRRAIPRALEGKDLVAMARTGSGKTAAFLLPLIDRLKGHQSRVGVRGLVLTPTRDLAMQTLRFFKEFSRYTDLRVVCVVGGESMDQQFDDLTSNPDVIIATPGRLLHLTVEVGDFTLGSVEYLVFDEADRLFELGLNAQIEALLSQMQEKRQTLLFSATMPAMVAEFVRAGLREPEVVRLDAESKISDDLSLAFFTLRPDEKLGALLHVLTRVVKRGELTIVFAATRHHVEFLENLLRKAGLACAVAYGTMDPTARKINVAKFRNAMVDILVVTDVAARGIDIPLLDHVINYDFPATPKLFVHRVGRAARAGRTGTAYSLIAPDETPYMVDLHLFLGRKLLSGGPTGHAAGDAGHAPTGLGGKGSGGGGGGGGAPARPSFYGRIPDDVLQGEVEEVRQLTRRDVELESQARTMRNAYKLYYKTRSGASSESVRRARELDSHAVHPVFAEELGGARREEEEARSAFLAHIRNYRPTETVFELRDAKANAAGRDGAKAQKHAEIMRELRRRNVHAIEAESRRVAEIRRRRAEEVKIESRPDSRSRRTEDNSGLALLPGAADDGRKNKRKNKRKRSSQGEDGDGDGNGNGNGDEDGAAERKRQRAAEREEAAEREASFKLTSGRPDRHADDGYSVNRRRRGDTETTRLEDTIMDVVPEDASSILKKRSVTTWDRRKKKYVTLKGGDADDFLSRSNRRTESGALLTKRMERKDGANAKKGRKSPYAEWQKRTHSRIPAAGETEDPSASRRRDPSARRYRHTKGSAADRASSAMAHRSLGGNRLREEVRTAEQIKAERRKTTRRDFARKSFKKGDSKKAGEGTWRDKGSSRRAAAIKPGTRGSAPPRSRSLGGGRGGGGGGRKKR